ncbi:unnamed protein product (macronuclear) [Paramecium tetraurelia]|uniref:FHA domain-containing protein n=1 Tax=Paramecium tetraurelia TaxID=5888 RepID=A0CL82_PARTE|nr:uncharacterized protein GSPATT00008096001 [Paramecium tetraurelia]CAK71549.1 unnamed protein product [Paramecium tetraurelia]|eukprot:XP_001438946.1 hypothetical protein (macronuclear) [Paramecium tetraurelia strain d4-2]
MSNFDNEIQDNQIEIDLSINRQIFSFLQQGIDQFNIFMGDIPPMRNDGFFEDGDNQIYFSLPRPLLRDRLSPREKPQNIQNYLQKRTDPIQNNQFDPTLPHIKVSQLKNMNTHHHYFINEFGLVDSQKNTNSVDILIGRQYRQNQDIIPNDIILPEDRVISRIHCKIIYNDYFRKQQILDPIYAKTLELIKLPAQIKYKISQFLENPKIVQIQDLGSIYGTYLRIFRQEPCVLKQGHKFSIGSDTFFNILLNHNLNPNLKDIDDEWYSIIKHLSTLKSSQKHEIHLSDLLNQIGILEPLESIKSLSIEDLYAKLREYSIPILIVKFQGQGVYINRSINLFVGQTQTDSIDFFVGRGSENNIKINSNTISRKQCRIKYSQKLSAWIINDGFQDRDSANGTWISVQTAEQSEQKAESNLIELHHNDEIKISDSILKLELFQGKKQGFGNIISKFLRE